MSGNAAICCEKCNVPMLSQHGAYHSQNGQIVCSLSCCRSLNIEIIKQQCKKHVLIRTAYTDLFAEINFAQCQNCLQFFNHHEYLVIRKQKWRSVPN